MKSITLFLTFTFLIQFNISSQKLSKPVHLKDLRDWKTYRTVKIGNQIWMAKNLSFHVQDGSWPLEMSEENRKRAGLLYSWTGAQEACPTGWHIPSKDEWQQLIDFVGKDKIFEGALVEGRSNSTGFSAVHGGSIDMEGFFPDAFASFWTSSESGEYVWYVNLESDRISIHKKDCKEWAGFSIRCVEDD